MSAAYTQLLEATIRYLEDLKSNGRRFISVSPQALRVLERSHGPRPEAASRPRLDLPRAPTTERRAPDPATPVLTPQVSAMPSPALTVPCAPEVPTTAPPTPTPVTPAPVATTDPWVDLEQRVLQCTKCPHLASSRTKVVFGVGNRRAELLFVGEAPGADEDLQGEPFVGKAGQLLTRIIQTMGLARDSVYIANILKCRPDTPGQASGNRKPTPEEMRTCLPYLHEQIDLIQPKVLVALGATAVEGLLGKTAGITRLRGHWQTYRGIPLMPTYHPAYLLRNQALSEKRRVWEDMLQVMEKLGLPISAKQRSYFLSGA